MPHLFSGLIYRIHHKDAKTGQNNYPDKCYVGQTRTALQTRWNQHKRAAETFTNSGSTRRGGKQAALYEAMSIIRIENFGIEVLEELHSESLSELKVLLNEAERRLIHHWDSLEQGWNKVAPPVRSIDEIYEGEMPLSELARAAGVHYNSLRHRVNKLGETPECAIEKLRANQKIEYVYGRQTYKSIEEMRGLRRVNPHKLSKAVIQTRIKKARESGELEVGENKTAGIIKIFLTDDIFRRTNQRPDIQLRLSSEEVFSGSIAEVHRQLLQIDEYKAIVPENYGTVQSRLNNPNQKWTVEQAFGLDVPPNFNEVKHLIETKGYSWVPSKPMENVGQPLVLHETREVFISATAFADIYKIPKDTLSDCLAAGKTPEMILAHFGLVAR